MLWIGRVRFLSNSLRVVIIAGDLHSLVAYGGVDALVWLCRSSSSTQLHHLVTTILAILAEKGMLTFSF